WLMDIPEYILLGILSDGQEALFRSWSWVSGGGAVWLRFEDFSSMSPDNALAPHFEFIGMDRDSGVLTLEAKRLKINHVVESAMAYCAPEYITRETSKQHFRKQVVQGY